MSEQRLIDATALEQDLLSKGFYPAIVKRAIEIAPTIEAEPVRHGKLVYKGRLLDCEYFNCSECETELSIVGNKPNYCPNCGARMDGDVT